MLDKILDIVDKNEAAKENVNVPTKRQFPDPEEVETMKRYRSLQWQLCPDSVDRLECFESYMVLWLHLVGDRQGKRTYVGKRASEFGKQQQQQHVAGLMDDSYEDTNGKANVRLSDILYGKVPNLVRGTLADDSRMQAEDDQVRNLLNEGQIRHMCSNSKNKDLCFRVELAKAMNILFSSLKGPAAKPVLEVKLQKRGLCDGVTDTVSCFDHYLGVFANMHPSSGGANQFVGRRMAYKR